MKIKIRKGLTAGLASFPDPVSVLNLKDNHAEGGTFGDVRRVADVDGKACPPLVAKLFRNSSSSFGQRGYQTTRELQRRLRAAAQSLRVNNRQSLLEKLPALRGAPIFSFEGEHQGFQVLGHVALDLKELGFEDFGHILESDSEFAIFQQHSMDRRLGMARQMIGAFNFLSNELHFLHADIKAEALFVQPAIGSCALIDYDSGAFLQSLADQPTTIGTRQDWLAPEVLSQLSGVKTGSEVEVSLASDAWAINVGLHYLLTGLHPLFFLYEISERSVRAYLARFRWPEVTPSFLYFRGAALAAYRQYLTLLYSGVPQEILDRMRFSIERGYFVPLQRTSLGQWANTFRQIEKPRIHFFKADRTLIADDREVILEWSSQGIVQAELDGIGPVQATGSAQMAIATNRVIKLRAKTWQGEPVEEEIRFEIDNTPPLIRAFQADTDIVTTAQPVTLSWDVTNAARIELNGKDVTKLRSMAIQVVRDMVCRLRAISHFGFESNAVVSLQTSKNPPTVHFFTADRAVLEDFRPVQLSWSVADDAAAVSIDGIGAVPNRGTIALPQQQDVTYVLTAQSRFGVITQKTVRVEISRKPAQIIKFRTNQRPYQQSVEFTLEWDVQDAIEVRIQPNLGTVPSKGSQRFARAALSAGLKIIAISRSGQITSKTLASERSPAVRIVRNIESERRVI